MIRFFASRGAKALMVAAVATGGLLIGGVANADTGGGSTDTGSGSPLGGLLGGSGLLGGGGGGGLLGGGGGGGLLGGTGGGLLGGGLGIDPLKVVDPILQPILDGVSQSTGLDVSGVAGSILGG